MKSDVSMVYCNGFMFIGKLNESSLLVCHVLIDAVKVDRMHVQGPEEIGSIVMLETVGMLQLGIGYSHTMLDNGSTLYSDYVKHTTGIEIPKISH